ARSRGPGSGRVRPTFPRSAAPGPDARAPPPRNCRCFCSYRVHLASWRIDHGVVARGAPPGPASWATRPARRDGIVLIIEACGWIMPWSGWTKPAARLRLRALAKLLRPHAGHFAENAAEILLVLVSDLPGNGADAVVRAA